jgi:hypothetical protein
MLRSIHLTFNTETGELRMVAADGPHLAAIDTLEAAQNPVYARRKAKAFVGQFLLEGVGVNVDTLLRMLDENWLSDTQLEVLHAFADEGPMTADEASYVMGAEVQPRVSELVAMGFLTETGDRRPTEAGKTARVYVTAHDRVADWFTTS